MTPVIEMKYYQGGVLRTIALGFIATLLIAGIPRFIELHYPQYFPLPTWQLIATGILWLAAASAMLYRCFYFIKKEATREKEEKWKRLEKIMDGKK